MVMGLCVGESGCNKMGQHLARCRPYLVEIVTNAVLLPYPDEETDEPQVLVMRVDKIVKKAKEEMRQELVEQQLEARQGDGGKGAGTEGRGWPLQVPIRGKGKAQQGWGSQGGQKGTKDWGEGQTYNDNRGWQAHDDRQPEEEDYCYT